MKTGPPAKASLEVLGWLTGIEPATFGITTRRSNRLSYNHHGTARPTCFRGPRTRTLVRPEGIEPPSFRLEGGCLIRLDHGRDVVGMTGFEPADFTLPKRALYQAELHPVGGRIPFFPGAGLASAARAAELQPSNAARGTGATMRLLIVGAGSVGTALGGRWSESGHDVRYGVRDNTRRRCTG